MKTSSLEQHSLFFDKKFRDDLIALAQVRDNVVAEVRKWLASVSEYESLEKDANWIPVAKTAGMPAGELRTLTRPIQYIARVAETDKVAVDDLLDDLAEAGIWPGGDEGAKARKVVAEFEPPLRRLIAAALATVPPNLPLPRIRSVTTRCVLVPEFDRQFDVDRDTLATYKPTLTRFHPMTTLELRFWDKDPEDLGVLLSSDNIDTLLKWLEFAKVQMVAAETAIPRAFQTEKN